MPLPRPVKRYLIRVSVPRHVFAQYFCDCILFMMFLPLSYKLHALLIIQFDRFDFCRLFVYFLLSTSEVRVTYYLGSYHHVCAFYSHEPPFRVIFTYLTSCIFKLFQSSKRLGTNFLCFLLLLLDHSQALLGILFFLCHRFERKRGIKNGIKLFNENDS